MKPTPNNNGTATVVLPAPNDGQEIVAAFRQPLPLAGMAKLCKAVAECYGDDAKLIPTGEWLAVSGTLCRPYAGRDTDPELKTVAELKAFRVCEMQPLDATDGGRFDAATPLEAAAKLLARHTGLAECTALFVWPDGEHPTLSNVLTIPMAEVVAATPTAEA